MSELRSGGGLVGIRLLRDVVRSSQQDALESQLQRAVQRLIDEVSGVIRNDRGPAGPREKAAEFIILLRAGLTTKQTMAGLINSVAEAAARARYRSGRIIDFLSNWLFICGEQFICGIEDRKASLELEASHAEIWNQTRGKLLETLEAGSERLRAGRRFRIVEAYLARFRLVRARSSHSARADSKSSRDWIATGHAQEPDFVASIVVDLFALSLSDLQQRLITSQIPGPSGSGTRVGFEDRNYARLWAPLRSARSSQAFENWPKVLKSLPLHEHRVEQEYLNGLATHLRRTWNWFFPDRAPFGQLRATLRQIDAAGLEVATAENDQARIERIFDAYASTLAFIVRLATEDSESKSLLLEDEDSDGGVL